MKTYSFDCPDFRHTYVGVKVADLVANRLSNNIIKELTENRANSPEKDDEDLVQAGPSTPPTVRAVAEVHPLPRQDDGNGANAVEVLNNFT